MPPLKHFIWSFLGLSIPALVALVSVPELINTIGYERFGLLGLAWSITSIGGMLDLGMGRSAVYFVSRGLAESDDKGIDDYLNSTVQISLFAGCVTAISLILAASSGIYFSLKLEDTPHSEVFHALLMLAILMPIQAVSSSLRGANEAFSQFPIIAIVRTINGCLTFLSPLLVSKFTFNLAALLLPLCLARFFVFFVFMLTARRAAILHGVRNPFAKVFERYDGVVGKQVMIYGGWTSISAVVSPMMVQGDRFFIGVALSGTLLGFYTISQEIIGQTLIVVGAVGTVIFPLLSRNSGASDSPSMTALLSLTKILLPLFLTLYTIVYFALPQFFEYWMPDVDPVVITISRILCFGALFNSIAGLSFAEIQSRGRSDVTAKAHLLELPLFAISLITIVPSGGLVAAALLWSSRAFIDCCILWGWLVFESRTPAVEEGAA